MPDKLIGFTQSSCPAFRLPSDEDYKTSLLWRCKDGSKTRRFQIFPLFFADGIVRTRCQYVGASPAWLTCPGNPCAETAAPATKRKPIPPICRHLGFCTLRETAFFAPATAPCSVQVNLRGLQMTTMCQIPGQITKCQIRCSVSAGKHETVPCYISTAP